MVAAAADLVAANDNVCNDDENFFMLLSLLLTMAVQWDEVNQSQSQGRLLQKTLTALPADAVYFSLWLILCPGHR